MDEAHGRILPLAVFFRNAGQIKADHGFRAAQNAFFSDTERMDAYKRQSHRCVKTETIHKFDNNNKSVICLMSSLDYKGNDGEKANIWWKGGNSV